jgi:hypothetical protein
MSFRSTKTAAAKRRAQVEYISAADVQSRCSAAARMVARGKDWSPDDRADIAAEVFLKVWEKAREVPKTEAPGIGTVPIYRRTSSVAHGPAVTYSKYSAQKSLDTVSVPGGRTDALRADLVAWSYLLGLASNQRRHIERERERDHAESLRAAEVAPDFSPWWVAAPAADVAGTPLGARRTAVTMLRELGLLTPVQRHGRTVLVAPTGPVWTLAYAAARAVEDADARGDLDRPTVARELGLSADQCKKHLQRAAGLIPASATHVQRTAIRPRGDRSQWAEALNIPEGGVALKPSRSRTVAADIGTRASGPRDYVRPKDAAEVRTVRSAKVRRKSDAWKIGPGYRPLWTRDLAPRTASRLAAAAAYRQERAAAGQG